MENQARVKCLNCGHEFIKEDPRSIHAVECEECKSINLKFVCDSCHKDTDNVCTAFLQDRSKRSGLCENCRDMVEEEDLDKVTFECFEKLCHAVNGGSVKDLAESMFRTIQRQHRYLQNEFFNALWHFFQKYGALDERWYDERNAWAVQVAKRWDKATFD